MLQWKLPNCPHCGKEVDFLTAWIKKTDGEYKCEYCGKSSDIKFNKKIGRVSIICEIIAFAIMLLCMFLGNQFALYGTVLVLLPFVYFYIRAPYMMRLEVIKKRIMKNDIMKKNIGRDNVRQRINRVDNMPISIDKNNH